MPKTSLRHRLRAALTAFRTPEADYERGYLHGVRDYPALRAGVRAMHAKAGV